MEDEVIVQSLWERKEEGILWMERKYENYCFSIASHIVTDREDAKECVNDTWLRAWNSIPPHRPGNLAGYLAKIVRNLSFNCYKRLHADKRGGGAVTVALEELGDCLSDGRKVEDRIEQRALTEAIASFLTGEKKIKRYIFMQRYFYLKDIKEIAEELDMREGTVKSILFRMRKKLRGYLEREGIYL